MSARNVSSWVLCPFTTPVTDVDDDGEEVEAVPQAVVTPSAATAMAVPATMRTTVVRGMGMWCLPTNVAEGDVVTAIMRGLIRRRPALWPLFIKPS